ncbi:MAG: DUF3105 domain-containing protein [Micromonosporaceae bacterium]|nr:DUF3105 domain-containing protein [Micromonosporaceae bacterium]
MTTKTNKGDRRNQPPIAAQRNKSKGGRKGRKPGAPVKVSQGRNWGPIMMFVAVGVIAAGIIGYAFWAQRDTGSLEWSDRAAAIEGIVDYRAENPEMLTNGHVNGQPLQYEVLPPVGGDHNGAWQNCQGNVYDAPIANEHAVHSLEHGAVWVTYNPDTLPADQVSELTSLVEGTDMMLLSPFPELDAPISLQAWGYQLKVDSASDPRINEFVRTLRLNASMEPGATCSGGITATGTVPQDVGDQLGG